MPGEIIIRNNPRDPRTRCAYQKDLQDFCGYFGLKGTVVFTPLPERTYPPTGPSSNSLAWPGLAWPGLAGATIRRKLAALARLLDHLLINNTVAGTNLVQGVKQPMIEINEGKTPALGDHQAKALLEAPNVSTLKGRRDRAILAVLLYHGLRREEATLSAWLSALSERETSYMKESLERTMLMAASFS